MVVRLPGRREADPVVGAGVVGDLAEGLHPRGDHHPPPGARRQAAERGDRAGVGLRHVHRIERIAEPVRGLDHRAVELGRDLERPAAGEQQHHLAPGRRLEAAQRRGRRGRRPAELGARLRADAVRTVADEGADLVPLQAVRVVHDPVDVPLQGLLVRALPRSAGGSLAGLFQRRGESLDVAGPAAQDVDPRAVEGQHGHAVRRPEERQVALQLLQRRVPRVGERERIVDVDQVAPSHLLPGGHRGLAARILRAGRGLPLLDLGAVFDRHLPAVHQQPEVRRREPADPFTLVVRDHRLDVDHPHVDRLSEDLHRPRRRSLLSRDWPRRQPERHDETDPVSHDRPPVQYRVHDCTSARSKRGAERKLSGG